MHFGFQISSLFSPFFGYHVKRMCLFGWCLTSSSLFFIGEIMLNFFLIITNSEMSDFRAFESSEVRGDKKEKNHYIFIFGF
jgi:hypothetical protein